MALVSKKVQKTDNVTPSQLDAEPLTEGGVEEAPATPNVTALVYSYNNAAGLRRCLAALEASSARASMEILVVDKGSQDESPGLDSEFPEVTFLRLPRNFGNTKALNIALRTGVGEFAFFLSPEIEVASDTVSLLVRRLEADNDAVAICPLVMNAAGGVAEQAYRLPTPQTGVRLIPVAVSAGDQAATVEYATFEAMLARKYFIRGINYFDDRFGEYGADAELCFQIQRAGRRVTIATDIPVVKSAVVVRRSSGAEALLEADRVHGTAVYFGKHFGFFSGISLRLSETLKALGGFRFGLLMNLVTGSKVDGSQGVVL